MSTYLFQLKNISYNGSDGFLNNLNIDIKPKSVLAIIVNNSAEQNTIIQSLQKRGQDNINGIVLYKGKLIKKNPFGQKGISLLQQKSQIVPELTVAENISINNLPKRGIFPLISWKTVSKETKHFLDSMDIEINNQIKVKYLSEEQKRLVYIASVFFQKPELIIMQEPMTGLTSKNAIKIQKVISDFKQNGGSILYITKQWEETLKIADYISIFSNGTIVDNLTAEAAKEDPQRLLTELDNYNFKKSNVDKDTQKFLDAVFKAAEFLTSEYELKDVLLLLAKKVANIMNADGCCIRLIDESTWSIIDDFEFKNDNTIQMQLTKDTVVRIATENNIFYTTERDAEFYSLFKTVKNIRTLICVPILIRSQVTGIIQIYYEKLYVYTKEESKYLSTLARHVAIAIEDTRLLGRSALLQESHHRIKNNLQSVIGLISLQKSFVRLNPTISIDSILDNIIDRIKSIASVHDLLSKEKLGRSIINLREIIDKIISILKFDKRIIFKTQVDDIFIPYNIATSIALVISELANNSLKHAFPNSSTGIINIQCKREKNYILIVVTDNGIGLPVDFDLDNTNSLGLTILQGIVTNELRGKLDMYTKQGTVAEIVINTNKMLI